jgi:endopeptidase La
MFPMEFNHEVLDSLPLPDEEGKSRVLQILKTICMARVMPYFRNRRVTDPTLIARVSERLVIERLEDDENLVPIVSMIILQEGRRVILIHERIFDYLAFVMPSDPNARLGGKTSEEGKMLAFSEFALRHQLEHMLYPHRTEREVIASDVAFAMEKRADDPTFYRMLRNALADEMNGISGSSYLTLFDAAEGERPYDYIIAQILNAYVTRLAEIPDGLLRGLFPIFDLRLKTKLLGEYYRKSRNTAYSLTRRSAYLKKVMELFSIGVRHDEEEAEQVFHAFKDRWGLVYLFHELDLPETSLEEKEEEEIFPFFKDNLTRFSAEPSETLPAREPFRPETSPPVSPTKSLKDRIEEARNDPAFPRQALEVIDKHKTSAVGHSGPKYTELIETLLALPWMKMREIAVTPGAFEEGLNRTHFGLQRPKEIICDFFTNLIWRHQHSRRGDALVHHHTGSAFLFVGPPGVGKTSLAISIATNLGIPYHKISLGGMSDETDLRGHGFTWEGSKPGAIVQGLIKMGVMNGMFIMDEADKTEKFAIATLLEILDPEQNHLFHDKYTETTVDIDLSNCHFILTANTLETVPPAVVDRCEVVSLARYGVEEKIVIARKHLIERIRRRYHIKEDEVAFDPGQDADLLRYLIKTYTYEAGVRQLERIIRTLFLRVFRIEIMVRGRKAVRIDREMIKRYLEPPTRPWEINEEDRVGDVLALGIDVERGIGSIIPVQATPIRVGGDAEQPAGGYLSMVHATGNVEKILDESRRVALTGILYHAETLGIDLNPVRLPIHLHFMGASTPKDGPSAGGAIGLALASVLADRPIRRDVVMTGEIDTQGRILAVGGLDVKLETACDAGCRTMIIPTANLGGEEGIERLPEALKRELQILSYEEWQAEHRPFDYERHALQVVAVSHIVQAADISFLDRRGLDELETRFIPHARAVAGTLRERLKSPKGCCCLFHPKEPEELDVEGFEEPFWELCRCKFILWPELKKAILARHPDLESKVQFVELEASPDCLPSLIEKIQDSLSVNLGAPARVSLVAPYYFLARGGMTHGNSPISSHLRLFANNYTVQGVKVKECKRVLNRALCHIALLSTEQLDDCPFLIKRNGIYTIDLSFIPEKYRLDVKRAERILNRSLQQWLAALEGQLQLRRSVTPNMEMAR